MSKTVAPLAPFGSPTCSRWLFVVASFLLVGTVRGQTDSDSEEVAQLKQQLAKARQEAETQKRLADSRLHALQIGRAQRFWDNGEAYSASRLLDATQPEQRGFEYGYLRALFSENQEVLKTGANTNMVGGEAITYSPDGKLLAAGGSDRAIRVWDAKTRKILHEFGGTQRIVKSLAISPDNKILAVGDLGRAIIQIDLKTGARISKRLGAHTAPVVALAFSPDSSQLVSGSWDGSVKVWEVQSGKEVFHFKDHEHRVNCVTFNRDGTRIASGSRRLKVWDPKTGKVDFVIAPRCTRVKTVAYSPDGSQIATGHWDARTFLQTWDAKTGLEMVSFPSFKQRVNSLAFSSDGKRLVAGGYGRLARICDVETGKEISTLQGHTTMIHGVAFDPAGTRIASVSGDSVRVFDAQPDSDRNVVRATTAGVFSPDSKWLAFGKAGNEVEIRSLESSDTKILSGHTDLITAIAFHPKGQQLATASADKTVRIWDMKSGKQLHSIAQEEYAATVVLYSSEGNKILTVDTPQRAEGRKRGVTLTVWDAETGERKFSLPRAPGGLLEVKTPYTFSPNGQFLVTNMDKKIRVYDAETGREVQVLEGEDKNLVSIRFSPDGKFLVAGFNWPWSEGDYIKTWEFRTGKLKYSIRGKPGAWASTAHWSPKDDLILKPAEGRVHVIQGRDGSEVTTLKGHTSIVADAVFLPSGKQIAAVDRSGKVKVWDAITGEEYLTLPHNRVTGIVASPNGKYLISTSRYTSRPPSYYLRIWRSQ